MSSLHSHSESALPAGEVLEILEGIEELERHWSGTLRFGAHGVIVVEARRVCWAGARGMTLRLTDRLRQQRSPVLTRGQIEAVVESCRSTGTPIGQALVASGLVSEAGLRVALQCHVTDAIAELARAHARATALVAHVSQPYDTRSAFSTSEILTHLGARRDYLDAAAARARLAATVLSTREAFAFVRASHGSRPCLIALQNCRERRVCELVEAAVAACSAFDVSEALEEKRSHVVAELARGESITAWREEDTYYAAYAHESPSLELSSGDTRATGMQFA
jgi:hypothetical protein